MSLLSPVGSFQAITSGGPNQVVTGLGGTPKVLFLFTNARTADGQSANADTVRESQGMASGATARVAQAIAMLDNTDTNFQHGWDESSVIYLLNHDGTVYAQADLVSFDADGFTLSWSTLPPAGIVIRYFALGGSDVTSAKVGVVTANNSGNNPATQIVTAVGFQADLLLFRTSAATAVGVSASAFDVRAMGAATATGQWALPPHGAIDTANCIYTLGTKFAALASIDATGWTWTWHPAGTQLYKIAYCAIKGPKVYVGSDTEPTTNTTQPKTGVGFRPALLMVHGPSGQAASVAASLSRGVATAPTARSSMTLAAKSVNPLRAVSDAETTSLLQMLSKTTGTVSSFGVGDLASLDTDGYTMSWTGTDGTTRTFGVVAFGANASTTLKELDAAQPVTATLPKTVQKVLF